MPSLRTKHFEQRQKRVALIGLNSYGSAASLTIRRLSFGVPNRSAAVRESKTIRLMGASTRSGKTTWINALVKYVYGVNLKDLFRLKLVNEEDGTSIHAHSSQQTEEITAYDLYYQDGFRIPFSLTVVDTPVCGNNGEIDEHGKEIVSLVREFFSHPNGIQVYLYKDEFN